MNFSKYIQYLRAYYLQYTVIFLCSFFFLYSEYELVPRWETAKFRLNDPRINKKYIDDELISDVECVLMSVFAGSIIISWYCMLKSQSHSLRKVKGPWLNNKPEWLSKDLHIFHVSMVCLALVLSINGALTNSLKLMLRNIRPDFIDRCQPDMGVAKLNPPETYYPIDICRQTDRKFLFEGLKSTPSGHTSFITCGLGFIFYWQSKFIIGSPIRHIWCLLFILIVMVSRVVDHKHHWYDVISGCLLGIGIISACWKWVYSTKRFQSSILPPPISI